MCAFMHDADKSTKKRWYASFICPRDPLCSYSYERAHVVIKYFI